MTASSKRTIILPHLHSYVFYRFRREWRNAKFALRNRRSPSSSISNLKTSFDPFLTIRDLREHRWSFQDAQYLILILVGLFAMFVIQSPGFTAKLFLASLYLILLLLPVTCQFFLPFTPILIWLILFYSCQFISDVYRPPIWVRVLPALENIFYGANLSNILSAHKYTILDILAWLPYGIFHFGAPAVTSIIMFVWGPPGFLPVFARTFGFMNIFGVAIQLLFPCSPPWYENLYGLAPANYSMKGSPAGLAAIDKLFGIDLYTSGFTASPMVFGAFPSLHAGNATLEALFLSQIFPRLRILFSTYVLWMCWATMYLRHHYAVDLVGGALLAGTFFYTSYTNFLPRVQLDKIMRWDYDYVDVA